MTIGKRRLMWMPTFLCTWLKNKVLNRFKYSVYDVTLPCYREYSVNASNKYSLTLYKKYPRI